MTKDEAVQYLTPHRLTSADAPIILTAGKAREAMRAIMAHIISQQTSISAMTDALLLIQNEVTTLERQLDDLYREKAYG